MKFFIIPLLSFPFIIGCLGPAPKDPTFWPIEVYKDALPETAKTPKWDTVRLASVSIRAPYDSTRLTVLRANGTLAFDSYHVFSAQPTALIRCSIEDELIASGLFAKVVSPNSNVRAPLSLEANITRFALDCRTKGTREASVAITLTLIKDHDIVSVATGECCTEAREGNYGLSFSRALTTAVAIALKKL